MEIIKNIGKTSIFGFLFLGRIFVILNGFCVKCCGAWSRACGLSPCRGILIGVCRPIKFVPFYSVSRLPKYLVGSGSQFLDFKKLLKINFHNNYGQVVVLICAVVIEI